jgi:hypothetical protein
MKFQKRQPRARIASSFWPNSDVPLTTEGNIKPGEEGSGDCESSSMMTWICRSSGGKQDRAFADLHAHRPLVPNGKLRAGSVLLAGRESMERTLVVSASATRSVGRRGK